MVNGTNRAGIGSIQDMVPNAGEQPWDDIGTHGGPEDGVADPHAGDRLGYNMMLVWLYCLQLLTMEIIVQLHQQQYQLLALLKV
jgi:hypothetical protein